MTITIKTNELLKIVKESAKIGSMINRVKASTITKKALVEKLEKIETEMREQTDAIKITLVGETIFIDVEEEFLIELIKTYGDVIKGVISIVTNFENKFNSLFSKWSKNKGWWIEQQPCNCGCVKQWTKLIAL